MLNSNYDGTKKKFEKKMNEELKDCSFNPKTIKMPHFFSNYDDETTKFYYMRKKNAKDISRYKRES